MAFHNPKLFKADDATKLDNLFGNVLERMRIDILNHEWDTGFFGGLGYSCRKLVNFKEGNKNIPNKFLLPDDKTAYTDEQGNNYQETLIDIKLPHTLHKIISSIDGSKTNTNSTNLALMLEINNQLITKVTAADKSDHHRDYLEYIEKLNKAAKIFYEWLIEDINGEIKSAETRIAKVSSFPGYQKGKDKAYLQELMRVRSQMTDILNNQQPNDMFDNRYINAIEPIMNMYASTAKTIMEKSKQDEKFAKWFNKHVGNYLPSLNVFNEKRKTRDLASELEFVVNKMINEPNKVTCEVNAVGEMIAKIGDETYNLSIMLEHQPNFNMNFNDATLDNYYEYLTNKSQILLPLNFPVSNYKDLNSIDCKEILKEKLKNDNTFEDCHAGPVLAINIYTSPAYIIMNKILREKRLSTDIFDPNNPRYPTDQTAADALKQLEYNLRRDNHGGELSADEVDAIVKESVMATVMATIGMHHAKHPTYDAGLPAQFDNDIL
ncbi:MAG: hypothetical protein JO149_04185, partial [Gammaproteobacteria bacterium]|nr:hypothetical protein [Gammaproteobacteria bacterium]